jgi:hypothetical protein
MVLVGVHLFKKNSDFFLELFNLTWPACSPNYVHPSCMSAIPVAMLENYNHHQDAEIWGAIVSWMRSYSGSIVMASRLAVGF